MLFISSPFTFINLYEIFGQIFLIQISNDNKYSDFECDFYQFDQDKSQKKLFVKLFTQNFPYCLASFIFSSFRIHPVFVTKVFLPC